MYQVLIVDDEPAVCKGLSLLIDWNAYGFEVARCASDGAEALAALEQTYFDVILSDIRMPEIDGMRLLQRLREQHYPGRVIIISAYQEFEYARSAIIYGVKNYLTKPINDQELTATLTELHSELDSATHRAIASDAHGEAGIAFRKFAIENNVLGQREQLRRLAALHSSDALCDVLSRLFQSAADRFSAPELSREVQLRLFLFLSDSSCEVSSPLPTPVFPASQLSQLLTERFLEAASGSSSPRSNDVVEQICEYIAKHYQEDINLVTIAGIYFMNPVYLGRLFKNRIGTSFNEYLTYYRMEKAIDLLRQNRYMVYEIAEQVGYHDLNYFYKKFKAITGMTPKEFKQLVKGRSLC